jgi:putative Mn2+ efflux pump MntP
MTNLELFIIAIGLSMDAFAVAVSIGLTLRQRGFWKALVVGLYFGIFQAIMPLIGFFAAWNFSEYVSAYAHWIAFALLLFLGGKMIYSAFQNETAKETSMHPREMLPLAIATSIDALAVGVSFAFLYVSILPAVSFIGVITFLLSTVGVFVGSFFGEKFKNKATFAGGAILVIMGLNILIGG